MTMAVRRIEHPDGNEDRQDTMAGACYEDVGLMSYQEGVQQLGRKRRTHSTSGEARSVGDQVSSSMGGSAWKSVSYALCFLKTL